MLSVCMGNFWATGHRRRLTTFTSRLYDDNFHVIVRREPKQNTLVEALRQPYAAPMRCPRMRTHARSTAAHGTAQREGSFAMSDCAQFRSVHTTALAAHLWGSRCRRCDDDMGEPANEAHARRHAAAHAHGHSRRMAWALDGRDATATAPHEWLVAHSGAHCHPHP
jgi:hypothetical protein